MESFPASDPPAQWAGPSAAEQDLKNDPMRKTG
jgi:hypothetical protein